MNITQIRSLGEKKTQRMVKLETLLDNMKNEGRECLITNMRHSLQIHSNAETNIYAKKSPSNYLCRRI
jgi:hypothetical protein